jgi:hypothetical protein
LKFVVSIKFEVVSNNIEADDGGMMNYMFTINFGSIFESAFVSFPQEWSEGF